jgi:hypothetical protein
VEEGEEGGDGIFQGWHAAAAAGENPLRPAAAGERSGGAFMEPGCNRKTGREQFLGDGGGGGQSSSQQPAGHTGRGGHARSWPGPEEATRG